MTRWGAFRQARSGYLGPMTVPLSTYRLQLHAGFTLFDAAATCPYLARLGVTHVYTSPILQAAMGSMHGYDTVDHDHIGRELGGRAGYDEFVGALRASGLGHVLDIVPNHMSTETPANAWWNDVLENGPSSTFASAFDIDWSPSDASLHNRLLVPILGERYGQALDTGRLRIEWDGTSFAVRYEGHRLPIDPRTYDVVLGPAAPPDPADAVARLNADPGALDRVLEAQNYRLTHWRYGLVELNYRRFFDITSLAAVRIEDSTVFDAVHRLPLGLIESGTLDGLRVDHPDGLLDPEGYLDTLARRAGGAWIVAEKILVGTEQLREWPIAGTTGYDFAALATALLVNPHAQAEFAAIRRRIEGFDDASDHTFEALVQAAKHQVLREILASEVGRLVALVHKVCDEEPAQRDHTKAEIRKVFEGLLVELDVYRTYARVGHLVCDADRHIIDTAVDRAGARRHGSAELHAFIASMLTLDAASATAEEVAQRFQQLSGPVMAKGVEDTATYRFVEMLALNDVGSDPRRFGATVEALHLHNERIQTRWPTTMTTLSTHDSKRSEDVRARLASLTWMPSEWSHALDALIEAVRAQRAASESVDARTEHFILQALAGSWPIARERMHTYVLKAAREMKAGTSWIDPDASYEARLRGLVDRVFDDRRCVAVLDGLTGLMSPIVDDLIVTQKAVQLMSPGVPDVYQGAELITDALVDPDNRRPVDFALRAALLDDVAGHHGPLMALAPSPRKILLTTTVLQLRREHPMAFGPDSTYRRLQVRGPATERIVAFARGHGADEHALLVARIGPRERDVLAATTVELRSGRWCNPWTGAVVQGCVGLDALLVDDPVALLVRC